MGAGRIWMANRGKVRREKAVKILKGRVEPLEWRREVIEKVLGDVALVVNGTTVGADGNSMPPVNLQVLPQGAMVYDMVYAKGDTPLVKKAKELGMVASNGLSMLLSQAVESFEIFTGVRPPIEPLKEELLNVQRA
jgi:shikimate dehydrogenase